MTGPYEAAEEPIFFDGAYMAYTATTYGATSTVVAMFWGTYLAYIVNAYGATSIVVAVVWGAYLAYIVNAYGATSIVVAKFLVRQQPLARRAAGSRSLTALGARGSLLRSLITIWLQGPR